MSAAPQRAFPSREQTGETGLVTISDPKHVADARGYCAELESGNILYFPHTPFALMPEDVDFLLGRQQSDSSVHKNIAYRPLEDRITGVEETQDARAKRLRDILRCYSKLAAQFVGDFLLPYRGKWKLDYASYRPREEHSRPARLRARNDLPHVDAFPTRPTHGDRILRFFTNINPSRNRVWITSHNFERIAPRFATEIGLPGQSGNNRLRWAWQALARALHFPGTNRSPCDSFMLRCHNAMKESRTFQQECAKVRWEFPPHSSWMVYTDFVSHAVLQGQYALEQTFIVEREAMVCPGKSPIAILEKLAGHGMA